MAKFYRLEEVPAPNKSLPQENAPALKSNVDAGPPDGGFWAWAQCVGSFFLFFNTWGIVNTFGVFQSYYGQSVLRHEAPWRISWIGSIQACLLIFVGVITGPLFDIGYLRLLLSVGSGLVVLGMMFTSLCNEYWQFVLAQGLLVGLGCGCLFVPSIAVLPMYFSKRKALATGIGASGSSLGGIIYPILFHRLLPHIGFGWATRIIAFIALATLTVPIAVMKTRGSPRARRRLFALDAWGEVPYSMFGLALFLGFMGLYIPFFYIEIYAIEKNIGNDDMKFYLLVFLNAGSFFGRLIPNYIADWTGPMNVLAPSCIITAILAFAWTAIDDQAGIIAFCIFYGLTSGAFVSLAPVVAVTLCPSLSELGVRLGMLFVPIAIGLLIGNPIAGAILKSNWIGLQCFCGVMAAISGTVIFGARIAKSGTRLRVKA